MTFLLQTSGAAGVVPDLTEEGAVQVLLVERNLRGGRISSVVTHVENVGHWQ